MTQEAINYGKILLSLDCSKKEVEQLKEILNDIDLLKEVLVSPVVSKKKKNSILNKIIKKSKMSDRLASYLKVVCKNGMMRQMDDIFQSYFDQWDEQHNIMRVCAAFAEEPTEEEKKEVNAYLMDKFPDQECICYYEVEPELLGGYKIRYGNIEYDKSIQNRLRYLEQRISS